MRSARIALFAVLLLLAPDTGGAKEKEPHPALSSLAERLGDYLEKRLPGEARVEVDADRLVVRCRTQEFQVHHIRRTGNISPETQPQEGPGYRGFLLSISLAEANWAARVGPVIPQTVSRPYWKLHIGTFGLRDPEKSLAVYLSWNRSCPRDVLERLLRLIAEDPNVAPRTRTDSPDRAPPVDGIRPELIVAPTFSAGEPVELLLAYHNVGTALRLLWVDGGASNPKRPAPLTNVEMIHVTRLGEDPESYRLSPRHGNSRGQRLIALMPRQTYSERTVINMKMWQVRSETTEQVIEGPLPLPPGRYRAWFSCTAERQNRLPAIDGKWRDPLEGVEQIWKGPRLVSNTVEFNIE